MCRGGMMSIRSTHRDCAGQLTWWPGDSPASPSAPQEKEKRRAMYGGSGPKCCESSDLFDPHGYSLRTYLGCALSALTSYSVIWKRKVTPCGRWWWVPVTSARRTEGIESGSWATP